jgi:hypothetical protein
LLTYEKGELEAHVTVPLVVVGLAYELESVDTLPDEEAKRRSRVPGIAVNG